MSPQEIERLGKLVALLDRGGIGIVEHLFKLEDTLTAKIKELDLKMPDLSKVLSSIKGKDGETPSIDYNYIVTEVRKLLKDGENYVLTAADKKEIAGFIDVPVVEKVIEKTQVIREMPMTLKKTEIVKETTIDKTQTGEEMVEKINELPTDSEFQIDRSHIKGLDDELGRLGRGNMSGAGATSGGRTVKIYDISPLLDGSTKTFTLPAMWRIIAVHASSAPFSAFINGTDFTIASNKITFTSQISAASTLAAGQTVLIQYAV